MNDGHTAFSFEVRTDEESFVRQHLYTASRSARVKRKRLLSRWLLPILYAVCGVLLLRYNLMVASLLVSVIWILFFPLWERKRYRNLYRDHVRESYRERFGKVSVVSIETDSLFIREGKNESRIDCAELDEIVELPEDMLIRFKGGYSLIIPASGTTPYDDVRQKLKDLAFIHSIAYKDESRWKWR